MTCRLQYQFITDYIERYRALPLDSTIRAQYPDWAPAEGEFGYWLDAMVRLSVARKAQKAIVEALERFDDPASAVQQLMDRLNTIRYSGSRHIVASDANALQRYERYLLRKEEAEKGGGDHVFGIRTIFDVINATHQGWMPAELIGILARPTVGKTWLLVAEAVNAWLQGNRILFITPEMPTYQIELRFDAFLANALGVFFSHALAYGGSPLVEHTYKDLAERLSQYERWWTVDTINGRPASLEDVKALHADLRPNIVYIDGVSIMSDRAQNRRGGEWESMKEHMYSLKTWCTAEEIPMMVTHQSGRLGKKTSDAVNAGGDNWRMPTSDDAYGGDAFIQACSSAITMCGDKERTDIRWYCFVKARERQMAFNPRLPMVWDVDKGLVRDLSSVGRDRAYTEATRLIQEVRQRRGQ